MSIINIYKLYPTIDFYNKEVKKAYPVVMKQRKINGEIMRSLNIILLQIQNRRNVNKKLMAPKYGLQFPWWATILLTTSTRVEY